MVTVSIGLVARMLRDERALLEVEDPAAGSELFTIRGMIRQIRESLVATKQALSFIKRRYWLIGGSLAAIALILTGGNMLLKARHQASEAKAALATMPTAQVQQQLVPLAPPSRRPPSRGHFKVQRSGSRFRVDATLNENGEIVVPMVGFATVPESWSARSISSSAAAAAPIGLVTSDGAVKYLSSANPTAHLVIDACKGNRPLAVSLKQDHAAGQQVVLYVSPKLEVANCPVID